jgi:hypothetical protein
LGVLGPCAELAEAEDQAVLLFDAGLRIACHLGDGTGVGRLNRLLVGLVLDRMLNVLKGLMFSGVSLILKTRHGRGDQRPSQIGLAFTERFSNGGERGVRLESCGGGLYLTAQSDGVGVVNILVTEVVRGGRTCGGGVRGCRT